MCNSSKIWFLRLWLAAPLLLLTVLSGGAAAQQPLPRSVLVFDQSDTNSPWGLAIRSTLRSEISKGSSTPVAMYSEVLELGRFNSPQYQELLSTFLRDKYRDRPIGVIVVHGSEALDVFMRIRSQVWPSVPVVFMFVDPVTLARHSLPPEFTGTTYRHTLSAMVASARMLVPGLKRLALVGTQYDKDPFRPHFTQELSSLAGEIEFVDLLDMPLEEVRKRISTLPDDAAVYYSSLYSAGPGTTLILTDVVPFLAQFSNRPIVTDNPAHIGRGSTGGIIVVPEPMAREAASRTLRILDGESPSRLPIAAGDFSKPIFDWRELDRWKISEARLPPGSEIRFKPPTMWDQYRWQMLTVLVAFLLQAAVIGWLLFERERRRRAERESNDRMHEVIHLNRTAAAGALSASVAHELNQPLGAILSNTEAAELLLKSSTPDLELVREILVDIRRDDQRAGEIIRSLRGLLRKSELSYQELSPDDEVRNVVHMLSGEARKRGVTVNVMLTAPGARVRADKVHLQQVMLNVAMNGMDAMVNGEAAVRRLTFQSSLNGSAVEIAVADNGAGIPQDKIQSVFETFYTTKPQGTGLGLSIARTIVETYGGKIWAENQAGGGAMFRFSLPLAAVPAAGVSIEANAGHAPLPR